MENNEILDTIGIGFGPSNIALAVSYTESLNKNSIKFLEANKQSSWQSGMLIEGSDIQHHPLRDFITPRNPCSKYGYLSYLKSAGRLFHFLNITSPFPPRSDYAKYVQWVADQFREKVIYSKRVSKISIPFEEKKHSSTLTIKIDTDTGDSFQARSLSFAPGRSKNIPDIFIPFLEKNVIHFTDYSTSIDTWKRNKQLKSVAIIGSSQSAVEILLNMHSKFPGVMLHSIFRNFSYVLKDTSPFTEDLLFPEAIDYFYHSSDTSKIKLTSHVQRSNYGSVDDDILTELYFLLYEKRVREEKSIIIHNNYFVADVSKKNDEFRLVIKDEHAGNEKIIDVDIVILATGFRNAGRNKDQELMHPLLKDIAKFYKKNEDGTLYVTRDYQLVPIDDNVHLPAIFINGLCESSHGLSDAGSFSLLSYRAFDIEKAINRALSL